MRAFRRRTSLWAFPLDRAARLGDARRRTRGAGRQHRPAVGAATGAGLPAEVAAEIAAQPTPAEIATRIAAI